jgi:hypothetical protein
VFIWLQSRRVGHPAVDRLAVGVEVLPCPVVEVPGLARGLHHRDVVERQEDPGGDRIAGGQDGEAAGRGTRRPRNG